MQQVSYLLRRTGRAGLVIYMFGGEVLDRGSSWFGIAIVVLYASNKSIQATCTCLLRSHYVLSIPQSTDDNNVMGVPVMGDKRGSSAG